MRRLLAVLLLLLAGAAAAHEGSDALEAAGAGMQREVLRGFASYAGHDCAEVSGLFMAGIDADGAHHWDVLCRDGLPHRITFTADPDQPVVVRDCLSLQGIERCFEPADPRVPRLRSQASRCMTMCAMGGRDVLGACMAACLEARQGED